MKWSRSHLYTIKEVPSDAEIPSHKLFIRAGFIKKVAPGIYTYGFMALRAIRKLEQIIREELGKVGSVEILMPMVHPKELWAETGRWQAMGDLLLKMKNRSGHEFCLGGTHEEVITDYVRHDIKSYRDLPKSLFQIQTKFRDEIRPRFGLMRGREFIMKDAYTFDVSEDTARQSYQDMYKAYCKIFDRLGVDYRVVNADSGDIGGDLSQEFHVLAQSGEDHLLVSEDGSFAANVEACPAIGLEEPSKDQEKAMEEFPTPGLRTIDALSKSLKLPAQELVKTLFYSSATPEELEKAKPGDLTALKPVAVLLRGSDELNPIKLKKELHLSSLPLMLSDTEVKQVTGSSPGSCGPVGLSIPVYVDLAVEKMKNFIVGANKEDFHLKNVNLGRDFKAHKICDLRMAEEGHKNPTGPGILKSYRGIEVGHIFYLGTKYSESMKATYLDDNGKTQFVEMGCYGIGVGRTVQAAIEQSHDEEGMIWPMPIAPFHIHICCLDPKDADVMSVTQDLYEKLQSQGVEVFVDDRDERPGVKFKDADLIGLPLRLTIGKRGLTSGLIELVDRKTKEKSELKLDQVVSSCVKRVLDATT